MQIIVNCFAMMRGGLVMLQKPRRGWWVLPGGKVEPHESWPEAARREMLEEAGLLVDGLQLRGVHHLTRTVAGQDEPQRMLIAQFSAQSVDGDLLAHSKEGKLGLITSEELPELPMDPGDKIMVTQTLHSMENQVTDILFGKFIYTESYELTEWTMHPMPLIVSESEGTPWRESHPQ